MQVSSFGEVLKKSLSIYSLYAAFLTAFFLLPIQIVVESPTLLLFERIYPGGGYLEIVLLAAYTGFIVKKLLDPSQRAQWRRRIWILFSIVFFSQLIIGLAGIDLCLMTGNLHFPIPAYIVGGPVYRGEGFFMPILFLSTAVLVGPAWCSYLCYIGSWDSIAADQIKKHTPLPLWWKAGRVIILVLIIAGALIMRELEVSLYAIITVSLVIGIASVGIMLFISRKMGLMVHCLMFCPIGILANIIGKISPFRIQINDKCTECMVCRKHCNYFALEKNNIQKRKPAISCTLCGDCINSCKHNALDYGFYGFSSKKAQTIFLVLISVVHTVFLGVARI